MIKYDSINQTFVINEEEICKIGEVDSVLMYYWISEKLISHNLFGYWLSVVKENSFSAGVECEAEYWNKNETM